MGTVEGLASMFVDFLVQATWADRVNILHALLRLFPEMSNELCSRLQAKLLYLLNLDQPPSLQVSPSTGTLHPHLFPEPKTVL
ncbi:WD repeat-containing protein KIAA1875 [Cricetulus griseus]|uniref:WD repeat-containing protein KIAA1875 n=1 Tax=Cricetulus griseus TaxID=10029 RepID=G3HWI1_CRIGR|nr:WD repeat-containing protein KIAA1875 [Cricetulus griseus]